MALSDGLTSYWKLDESTGNASDSVSSNTLTNSSVTYSAGKINNGANLASASSANFNGGNITAFNFGTGDFSYAFWMKTSTNADGVVLGRLEADTTTKGFSFITRASNTLWMLQDNANVTQILSATFNYADGAWHHYVVSRISGVVKGYIDNSEVASASYTNNITSSSIFYIGRPSYTAGRFFNGSVDEVGVWGTRGLTTSDISALYNSGNGLQYPFGSTANTKGNFFAFLN